MNHKTNTAALFPLQIERHERSVRTPTFRLTNSPVMRRLEEVVFARAA